MKAEEKAEAIIKRIQIEDRRCLTEHESKEILKAYKIPTTQERLALSAEAAGDLAEAIGFPVVLKICSPNITHKTDIGKVVSG